NLANAYLIKGRIDDSIETNLKALKLHPEFGLAHNNLAIAYLEKGEHQAAIEHCEKAVASGYEVPPEILKEIEELKKINKI
ncbi:MAG: tetratricopeptide repeat protein, partial [Desulfobacterales bacterium]